MTPRAITKQFVASKVCQNRNGKGEQGLWLKLFLMPPWCVLGNSGDYSIKSIISSMVWEASMPSDLVRESVQRLQWLYCAWNISSKQLSANQSPSKLRLQQPTTSLGLPNTLYTDAGVDVITSYKYKPSVVFFQNCVREFKCRKNSLTCLSTGSRSCDVLPSFHVCSSQRPVAQSVSLRLEEANRGLSSDMPQGILS